VQTHLVFLHYGDPKQKEVYELGVKKKQESGFQILRNPSSVKQMAAQVKIACDLYTGLKLSEKSLEELILHFAGAHGKKFFGKGGTLNPTLAKIIGKKRCELVEIMLSDFQMTLI